MMQFSHTLTRHLSLNFSVSSLCRWLAPHLDTSSGGRTPNCLLFIYPPNPHVAVVVVVAVALAPAPEEEEGSCVLVSFLTSLVVVVLSENKNVSSACF